MKNTFGIYMALLLLFSSCIAGKNYERPTVELPQQWNNVAPSDTSIAGIQWRQFFKDPVLLNLIDTAIARNYNLQLAMKRIDEAEAYVKQAKANYIPVVTAQATASTSTPSKNSLNGKSLES